jgi:hypothetical protein
MIWTFQAEGENGIRLLVNEMLTHLFQLSFDKYFFYFHYEYMSNNYK